jgi:hypothetical protein
MNKYDLNHRVVQHPKMSAAEWEEAYREAWCTFYTPEHIKTVMRRAAACGMNAGKVMVMLFWFLYSFRYDKVHPLESGYFRLQHRRDRRPGLARESMLVFYPRFAWQSLRSHFWMGYWLLRMEAMRQRIKLERKHKRYADLALQTDVPDEFDNLEMFQVTRGGTAAVDKKRGEDAARAAVRAVRQAAE